MPHFAFEAYDGLDKVKRGMIQAGDREAAVRSLTAQGLTVGALRESRPLRLFAKPGRGAPKSSGRRAKSLERFMDEWARLMQIGLTIDQALTISCTSHGASPKGLLAATVRRRVREGQSLARALAEAVPGRSTAFIACIEAGERSGHLPEMLEALAKRIKAARAFSNELRAALAYPCFVLATTAVLIGVLIEVVLPSVAEVLTSSDARLPWSTQAMLDGAAFLRADGLALTAGLFAALAGLSLLLRAASVRVVVEAGVLKLPVAGRIILAIEVSSYVFNLSVQLRGGVGVSRAVKLCQSALTLEVLRRKAAEMEAMIARGLRLSQAAAECFALAKDLPALIRIGEENGRLAEVLAHAGEHYESQARHELKVVTSLITPAVTIATGCIVGAVVMSMMSALVGLNDFAFR